MKQIFTHTFRSSFGMHVYDNTVADIVDGEIQFNYSPFSEHYRLILGNLKIGIGSCGK